MSVLVETKRLRLRGWQDKDRAAFAELNRDPEVMRYLGPTMTRQDSDATIDKQIALMDLGEPAFWAAATSHDDKLIGCIGVKRVTFEAAFTPCYEIGWGLSQKHWGKGYATEGAKAALTLAFERWGLPEIYSFTVHANNKSQAVMQRIGMHYLEGEDFDHPALAENNPLLRHVLYKIDKP